jgi:toxin ParE1/3/4
MAEVVWDAKATEELRQIIRYINQFDPTAADGIGMRLFDLGNSLADFPDRGRRGGDDIREMTNVPPYILRYEMRGDRVTIVSIRHGARKAD